MANIRLLIYNTEYFKAYPYCRMQPEAVSAVTAPSGLNVAGNSNGGQIETGRGKERETSFRARSRHRENDVQVCLKLYTIVNFR